MVPLENYCIANVKKKKRIVQGWAYGRKFIRLPTEKEAILCVSGRIFFLLATVANG